jgi:periplasmic nitrate reductase NapE
LLILLSDETPAYSYRPSWPVVGSFGSGLENAMAVPEGPDGTGRKRWELGVFLAVIGVIIPLLTVLVVAGYGFAVWVFQMLLGPPGPPN